MFLGSKTLAILVTAGSIACASDRSYAGELQVGASVAIPTARMTIYPGDEISQDMLTTKTVDRGSVSNGMVRDLSAAVGKVARRTLVVGQAIPASALRSRQDVVQGRQYKLIYRDAYLSIAASGIALQSAAVGDTINVRNADTGVVVRARIAFDRALVVEAP